MHLPITEDLIQPSPATSLTLIDYSNGLNDKQQMSARNLIKQGVSLSSAASHYTSLFDGWISVKEQQQQRRGSEELSAGSCCTNSGGCVKCASTCHSSHLLTDNSSFFPAECDQCFHNGCVPFVENSTSCRGVKDGTARTVDRNMPVNQWSSANVIEWMAALNLYRYAEVFKSKDIKGSDLVNIDNEKLQSMGIKDEFHQKAILVCIDELCRRNCNGNGSSGLSISGEMSTPASHHRFTDHSFNSLTRCGQCNKYLRGIIHQGLICQGI